MKNLRPFQIGLLIAFALIGIFSVVLLAGFEGSILRDANPYGDSVEIWGALDSGAVYSALQAVADEDENFRVVSYSQLDPRDMEESLVNAIAEGRAPDAIIFNSEELVTYQPKLLVIPYDSFSLRTFRDSYIDGAEIFARSAGIYAFPIAVDPLVMYWNRDIFSSAGLSLPPATWEALTNIVQQVTLRDFQRNVILSTIAFGEYRNVKNAKAALLTLTMQSGSRMIVETDRGYEVSIGDTISGQRRNPLTAALQFFIEFSNTNSPYYSWNRSFDSDLQSFVAEDLALYLGYGSESAEIRRRNPNLNFDVTRVPQGAGATVERGYGKFYGIGILKSANNTQGAYLAMQQLNAPSIQASLTEALSLGPVQRSVIAAGTPDPNRQVTYDAALVARGWLDPDPEQSDDAFRLLVEDVVSSREEMSAAVSDVIKRLELAF